MMIHCNSYKASMRAEHFLYFNKVMNFMHSHDSYPMIQLLLKSAHDPDYSALFGHRIFSFFTNEKKFPANESTKQFHDLHGSSVKIKCMLSGYLCLARVTMITATSLENLQSLRPSLNQLIRLSYMH